MDKDRLREIVCSQDSLRTVRCSSCFSSSEVDLLQGMIWMTRAFFMFAGRLPVLMFSFIIRTFVNFCNKTHTTRVKSPWNRRGSCSPYPVFRGFWYQCCSLHCNAALLAEWTAKTNVVTLENGRTLDVFTGSHNSSCYQLIVSHLKYPTAIIP